MAEICTKCGLPKSLCVCEALAKEKEKIKIFGVQRKFRKITTVVEGIGKESDPKHVLKELKTRLACGGTLKDGVIGLQGNHKERVKEILIKLGFPAEQIEIG